MLIGAVIAYVRRKEEIGGWLLFFYTQLYLELAESLLVLPFYIANVFPGKWGDDTARYIAFLSIAVSASVVYVLALELFPLRLLVPTLKRGPNKALRLSAVIHRAHSLEWEHQEVAANPSPSLT